MTHTELIFRLYEINAVKFGQFKLVSGITSPIYLDLKMTIAYPDVLSAAAEAMWQQVADRQFDLLCGVPYTALPIATVISVNHNKPMVIRRKEKKTYGIIKPLEGVYKPGQNVLVVEDLITSGTSIFETIQPLIDEHLQVTDAVVLIDREQGGRQHLAERGYTLHSVFTLSEILQVLANAHKLSATTVTEVAEFIRTHQVSPIQR